VSRLPAACTPRQCVFDRAFQLTALKKVLSLCLLKPEAGVLPAEKIYEASMFMSTRWASPPGRCLRGEHVFENFSSCSL